MNYKGNRQLKEEAKQALSQKAVPVIVLSLIPSIITFLASFIINFIIGLLVIASTYNNYQATEYESTMRFINIIVSFVIALFTVPLYAGVEFTFLDLIRDKNRQINITQDLLQIFKNKRVSTVLGIYFIQIVIIIIGSLLFIIPGIIAAFAMSQSNYVLKDKIARGEDITAFECIKESNQLMKGQKTRLFILQLSFIGWIFITMITCGLAAIYVEPYLRLTQAAFYNDLTDNNYTSNDDNDLRFFNAQDRYHDTNRYSNNSVDL